MGASDFDGFELSQLREGDRVVTPLDEVATVTAVRLGSIGVRYLDALNKSNAEFSLLTGKLLAPWPHGKPRPSPVRIK